MTVVRLMLTCLCDAFYGEVGIATVKVLEAVGCEVIFEDKQTCCGQPPFNAGDWGTARTIARHCLSELISKGVVVSPSSSCAAMVRHGYPMLFDEHKPSDVFELSEFLVKKLRVNRWPATKPYSKKIAFHRACHGRALGLQGEQEQLLESIPGVELLPIAHSEQCCGFGGSFSVTHATVSAAIGIEKLDRILESGAEEVVSGDMGCLMHLKGLIAKQGYALKARHFAEVLAEVL